MKRIGILVERQRAYGRSICLGISRFAQERGDWSLKALEWADANNPRALREFDGFIVRILNGEIARAFLATRKPVVDVYRERIWPGVSSVDQHARLVGQMAARHFLERHFTNFAFCGYNGRSYSDARQKFFTRCLALNHFACSVYDTPASALRDVEKAIIRGERLALGADGRALEKWIRKVKKPVAVFCSHDLRAYQLTELCIRSGLRVPEDVAVLGVDNDELVCNFTTPTISSIDLNGTQVGLVAAKTLAERLDRPDLPPCHVNVKPSGLIVRQSTQIYPVEPPWLSDALVFIHGNVTRHLTASDVFAHVGRSHTLVSHAFKKALGTTVQREIRKIRLDEAKRLVVRSDLPFTEIARRTGFGSIQYFSASFAAAFGKPPSCFRSGSTGAPHRSHARSRTR